MTQAPAPNSDFERVVADFVHGMNAHERIRASVQLFARVRGMRQVDVAEAIGMERTAFNNRMRGRSRWTSEDLDALGRLFGVDIGDLLGEALIRASGSDATLRSSALIAISTYMDQAQRARSTATGHATVA